MTDIKRELRVYSSVSKPRALVIVADSIDGSTLRETLKERFGHSVQIQPVGRASLSGVANLPGVKLEQLRKSLSEHGIYVLRLDRISDVSKFGTILGAGVAGAAVGSALAPAFGLLGTAFGGPIGAVAGTAIGSYLASQLDSKD